MLNIEIVFFSSIQKLRLETVLFCVILPKNPAFHQSPFFIRILHKIRGFSRREVGKEVINNVNVNCYSILFMKVIRGYRGQEVKGTSMRTKI